MKFHSEFDIRKLPQSITHGQKLLLIGSCFTENIGEKLLRYKFDVLQNPNGILFNPVSVADALLGYIDNRIITGDELFTYNEAWHSWNHHSRFSATTPEGAVAAINTSTQEAYDYIRHADQLMITLGSAWTYVLTEKAAGHAKGRVAANNHKAPADWFYRKLLTPEEVVQSLDTVIQQLFQVNPDINIIFTISPVRHLREGAVENNRSKAVLIQSVHLLVDKYEQAYYFPAYELVIDDLRDYRFYAEDLVHPNYAATNYVWEKFIDACMSEPTKKLITELHAIHLAYKHLPFNPASNQHKAFLRSFYDRTKALLDAHPTLNLTSELNYFSD